MTANDIPRWCVLTYHIPALGSRATIRLSRKNLNLAAITSIPSSVVVVFGITTINRSTSHFRGGLPHELREMASFLREPGRLVEVIVFPLIAPGFNR